MNNTNKPVKDDDDDRWLFERLEANAINHYPNPSRAGCPSRAVLKRFIEAPQTVTVDELKDFHIFQCAECTLELKQLREERAAQLNSETSAQRKGVRWWAFAFLIIVGVTFLYIHANRSEQRPKIVEQVVSVGLSPDEDVGEPGKPILVFCGSVILNVRMPSDAPSGEYEIVVSRERSLEAPLRKTFASLNRANRSVPLTAFFDLRDIPRGEYWLVIRAVGKNLEWHEALSIR